MNPKRAFVSAALAVSVLGSGIAVTAQEASPQAGDMGLPPTPAGCTVLASGLVNPRYVAVADDGAIYVSEAGIGGDDVVAPPAQDAATPQPGGESSPPGTRGYTGQVTRINPDGTTEVVASGLVSYASGMETIGPAGIAVAEDGTIVLANGGAGPAAAFTEPLEGENSVLAINPETGETTILADIGAAERASNPDGFAIDTNLYGLEIASDGTIWVNDAGGNATYRIAPGGEPEVVAVHPGLPLPEGMEGPPGGNPNRDGAMELDPVPTDLAIGENGRVFSGLLSGGPFPPGAAKVVIVEDDGTLTDVSGGLTMVVGMAIGPDGHLYATQLSTSFLGEMPEPGNIVRVHSDKAPQVVLEGLFLPNGIALDADGNLIVVNQTLSAGEPMGQVLRCEGITASADAPETLTIEVGDMWYYPAEFSIPADTDVTIRVVNKGFATHDLTFTGLGITSELITAGEEAEFVVNLPAGDYAFGCDVPGHRIAGMTGMVHVGK